MKPNRRPREVLYWWLFCTLLLCNLIIWPLYSCSEEKALFHLRPGETADGPRDAGALVNLLPALARVESGLNPRAIGAIGERGLYQFRRAAWEDTTKRRARRGLPTYAYSQANLTGPATHYALDHLQHICRQLKAARGIPPDPALIYAAWNIGLNGLEARDYRLENCPETTRAAARRFTMLVLHEYESGR